MEADSMIPEIASESPFMEIGPLETRNRAASSGALPLAFPLPPLVTGRTSVARDLDPAVPVAGDSFVRLDGGDARDDYEDGALADLPWLTESFVEAGSRDDRALPVERHEGVSSDLDLLFGEISPAGAWDEEIGMSGILEVDPFAPADIEEPDSEETIGTQAAGQVEAAPSEEMDRTPAAPERHVEDLAQRLERIARSLREKGAEGPISEDTADPLGALITGYLLGMSKSDGS